MFAFKFIQGNIGISIVIKRVEAVQYASYKFCWGSFTAEKDLNISKGTKSAFYLGSVLLVSITNDKKRPDNLKCITSTCFSLIYYQQTCEVDVFFELCIIGKTSQLQSLSISVIFSDK